jgi:hypothetical protein
MGGGGEIFMYGVAKARGIKVYEVGFKPIIIDTWSVFSYICDFSN